MFDEEFPRSIRFSTARIEEHLTGVSRLCGGIPATAGRNGWPGRLKARLQYADVENLDPGRGRGDLPDHGARRVRRHSLGDLRNLRRLFARNAPAGLRTEFKMLLEVRHVTQYHYAEPVRESVMEIWMQPQKGARQRLVSFDLELDPAGSAVLLRRRLRQRRLSLRCPPAARQPG